MTRLCLFLCGSAWIALAPGAVAENAVPPGWQDVRRIFETRCVNCHSVHGAARRLRLDSVSAVLAGSENGAVVLAGDAPGSELIRRLRGESAPRMPFLGPALPPEEIDLIARWIAAGLPEGAPAD